MGKENEIATAPYNFVSLPKTVLASPMDGNAVTDEERTLNYRTHVLEKGRLSGRIELTIETKTPVFIGTGVGTAEDKDPELFFSPMDVPMIPGSSLRGMIKNLFKIVTCGAMRAGEDYQDAITVRVMKEKCEKRVSDHVEQENANSIDYADAVFGCKELWASRLAFTDGLPEEEPQMDAPDYPKILSSPKPTAVQLYLEQKHGAKKPVGWDSDAPIRGYKLYWHQKNGVDWHGEKPKDRDERRKIQPVKKGTKFFANIRFERLSEDELGALLKTLRINGDHLCCKIGKGKSLGLGSIEITSSLVLMDMKESYLNAFDGVGGWNRAESTADNAKIQNLITAFDNYVKDREINYDKSIEELRHMLDWSKTEIHGWKEEIEQMSIQDERKPFQKRWILPTALEVGKKRP